MVQELIKKVLRKWLKKKVYANIPIANNIALFEWVYNSPLYEWRDRIWIVTHCPYTGEEKYEKYLHEYLYS